MKTEINLSDFEHKYYSQNGEDGVIEKIFQEIGTSTKYFVEIGVESGSECNTRYLRELKGWSGLMLDARYKNEQINLQHERITAENINQVFQKYYVPNEFDLLSIDIDCNDFYVLRALDQKYKPRVIIVEYNSWYGTEDKLVPYNPNIWLDGTNYWGAGILPFYKLARKRGYSLIYAENKGVNLFFVQDQIIDQIETKFIYTNHEELIYKPPFYIYPPEARISNRPFVKSADLL